MKFSVSKIIMGTSVVSDINSLPGGKGGNTGLGGKSSYLNQGQGQTQATTGLDGKSSNFNQGQAQSPMIPRNDILKGHGQK